IAAINGLIYLFLVPPWQHYDEPGHFEYVWLFSRLGHIPKPDEVDYVFRREVTASMVEHNFFHGMGWTPNLIDLEEAPWIGISQTDDQPFYYFIVSLPLRLFSYTDVTFQLYLSRLVSWGLFLFTVWVGKKAAEEWFGEDNAMVTLLPLFLATLPGFVDLMTAVNNDVGAIAFSSLFFWMAGSLMLGKISFWRFLLLVGAVVACYFTKSTAWLAIALAPLALFLAVPLRRQIEWIRFVGVGVAIAVGLYVFFDWNTQLPLYYYSNSPNGLRSEIQSAPLGRRVFVLESGSTLRQAIPSGEIERLRGKVVTLGAWIWGEEEGGIGFFELIVDGKPVGAKRESVPSDHPQFFQRYYLIPREARQAWIVFGAEGLPEGKRIYLEGISLVEGLFTAPSEPQYLEAQAKRGTWQGDPVENLVRNGSAEQTVPQLAQWVSQVLSRGRIESRYFWSLLDFGGVGWFYKQSLQAIFRTFWGYFGWAHVPLLGKWTYSILLGFTFLAVCGIVWQLSRLDLVQWRFVLFFGMALISQLLSVLLRGAGSWDGGSFFISARYFFPAILPTALMLLVGLSSLLVRLKSPAMNFGIILGFFILLNGWSWYSIYSFYYSTN
ncbi:MAG: DUF2142 domain-containing protein, partial [Thermosphaera sp.]